MVQQYWGSKAIAERLGYSHRNQITKLIKSKGLPAFRRRVPGRAHCVLYSDSELITRWLLSLSGDYRGKLLKAEEARAEQRAYALTPQGKRFAQDVAQKRKKVG